MVSDYLWWYVCSRCLGDVIEIYGDVNRFLGSCYELLRQKWQDSLRSPDELRADLWSSKRDSGHDPKKWADRLIFRDRVKLWSQWQQSGWISWASQSDLPWLTVTYRPLKRHESTITVKIYTRLLQAMSVGWRWLFLYFPSKLASSCILSLVGHKKSCVCSFAPLTRGKLSRTFFHHEFWQLESYVCVINDNIWKKWKVHVQVFVPKQQHVAALLLNRRFGFPSASASHATRFVCGQHPPLRARRWAAPAG